VASIVELQTRIAELKNENEALVVRLAMMFAEYSAIKERLAHYAEDVHDKDLIDWLAIETHEYNLFEVEMHKKYAQIVSMPEPATSAEDAYKDARRRLEHENAVAEKLVELKQIREQFLEDKLRRLRIKLANVSV
jgi:molecular chaperone GrpE (heat shock protein)